MLYQIDRKYQNQVIKIPVHTRTKERLVIKVKHYNKPYTNYFDTAPIIEGYETFIIKIPKIPKSVIVELYNDRNGNIQTDDSFQVGRMSIAPINIHFAITDIKNKTVSSFASFSDEFAENAGIMSAQNSVYVSPNGKYHIHYKDIIRDDDGNALKTPARINSNTGIIEIAKKYYMYYTVPGRKAINWHEFSHLWRNVEKANEIEADKNAIAIYLSMGNPIIEAYNVFLKVFNNSPTNTNRKRYDELNEFIKKFDNTFNKQIKN